MIAKIEGVLEQVIDGAALVRTEGGLTYRVLLPAFTAARLAASDGEPVTFHTVHFIEGSAQGTTMMPRLAGFLSEEDRRFFELFTTVKGIGNRKALRAMSLDTGQLAGAVADRDTALLTSLPEIGRRTAETIIASLSGKVDAFVSSAAYGAGREPAKGEGGGKGLGGMARETLEILLQLGENRVQALQWIDRALHEENPPEDAQALLARVYEIKAGG